MGEELPPWFDILDRAQQASEERTAKRIEELGRSVAAQIAKQVTQEAFENEKRWRDKQHADRGHELTQEREARIAADAANKQAVVDLKQSLEVEQKRRRNRTRWLIASLFGGLSGLVALGQWIEGAFHGH